MLFILPVKVTSIALALLANREKDGRLPFYVGWRLVHTEWTPIGFSYSSLVSTPGLLPQLYVVYWAPTILAFITFGLFGLSAEARSSYGRVIHAMARRIIGTPTLVRSAQRAPPTLGSIQFEAPPPEITLDGGLGYEVSVMGVVFI